MPLPVYSPCMNVNGALEDDQLDLILSYFKQGCSNLEMLEFWKLHEITISISTLKRRLRTLGLSRHPANIPLDELKGIIERELGGSGCFAGYRRIWARLQRRKGHTVKRITVMKLLRELDQEGVESRKRKRLRQRIYYANLRIEAYWSDLAKDGPSWWINFLKICVTWVYLLTQIQFMLTAFDFASSLF